MDHGFVMVQHKWLGADAKRPQRSLSPVAKNKNSTHHFVYLNFTNLWKYFDLSIITSHVAASLHLPLGK